MSKFVTLLVEDDVLQRQILSDALKCQGYEVVECSSAEAAELIIASTGNELKALVTDQNLAGHMTGVELADYARGENPRLNIIVTSGREVTSLPANTTFLSKPFLPEQLLEAVNR
jgi:DNA-binding NtrC family response regulator